MRYLVLILKGMVYGLTHIVPGLGGGLALILLGIYEPFVDAVGNFFLRRDRWGEYIPFLGCVGLGMVITGLCFARVASSLLDKYPAPTMFFFMGLMLGTIPTVLRIHDDMRPSAGRVLALLGGLALVVGIRSLERLGVRGDLASDPNSLSGFAYTVVASFFGGCASVTPGMDGSYVLIITGVYKPILEAITALTQREIRWSILGGLGIGAIAGIVLWSKAVDTAIKRAPSITYYVVLGLVVGSLYGLWPSSTAGASLPVMVLTFVAGLALALVFGRSETAHTANDTGPETEEAG